MAPPDVNAPARTTAFRCSPWTQAQGVDPIGSAGTYDTFVLVETPLPWPDDIAGIPALAAATAAHPPVRVQAVAPCADRPHGRRQVTVWHRTGAHRMTGVDHEVASEALPDLLAELVADPSGSPATVAGEAPTEVLVCTHGRRDVCCGRLGMLLYMEATARLADVRVRRCSHTGGHRYAPTAITFPDARMWAYLDADVLERVVRRSGDVAALRPHQRGTTALDQHAQVIERAVFEHHGWSWLEADVTHARVEPDGAGGASVDLRWRGTAGSGLTSGQATGLVTVGRDVPVLVCGQPPERATKTNRDLVLTDLRIDVACDR